MRWAQRATLALAFVAALFAPLAQAFPVAAPAAVTSPAGHQSATPTAADPVALRNLVLAGGITSTNPLVAIGDSHTDNTTSAHFLWDRLKTVRNQVGEGLEGVASAAIVPMGNNGQTLSAYLAGGGPNTFTAAMALNPSVVWAQFLTNDVRLGALGTSVASIRANGSALLNTLIANIKAAQPSALIVLRVPTPYLTVDVNSNHYVTNGTTTNPQGLAQIYTDGVRLAFYDAAAANPGVLVYDPQTRTFGTTSPRSLTSTAVAPYGSAVYWADQIHEAQGGYQTEADDTANYVNAPQPYSAASTTAARSSSPYAPWSVYSRALEDASNFVQIADAAAVTVTSGNTFIDFGPSAPNASPTLFQAGDIIEIVAGASALQVLPGSSFAASGANTRISLGSSGTVPATAVANTKIRVYRQTQSGDADVNAQINGTATYKRYGRVSGGGTTFLDIYITSLGSTKASGTASTWATEMQSGDKVYVEGRGATPITVTSNFSVSGSNLRITGLSGFDYSTIKNRIVVITGNH